jgi:predicted TPR repeat methyltransferase
MSQNACGVDNSPEHVKAARKLGLTNVHCGDLREFLQKHPEEFDCITALDVLKHFPKEEVLPLLDTTYQALKQGGAFIMQVPIGGGLFYGVIRYGDFTHSLAFTKESIAQVLAATGFTDVQVYPTGLIIHGLLSRGRWVLWQTLRFLLQLGLAAETGSFRGRILAQNLIAVAQKPDPERVSP